MGPDEQAQHDAEADAFFAQFIDAPADVIAQVEAERDSGSLSAIVAEMHEARYWNRVAAPRAARRAAREKAAETERAATAARFAHRDETARLNPLPAASLALLPAPRVVQVTDVQRRAADTYFRTAARKDEGAVLARRLRSEERRAAERVRKLRRQRQIEQRLFEYDQWQAARTDQARRRAVGAWSAIGADRALEIAIAALNKTDPPQGRK